MARIRSVDGRLVAPLDEGWEMCTTPPGAAPDPAAVDGDWIPARVPGTAAAALRDAGRWSLDDPAPLHHLDVWYRVRYPSDAPHALRFHGLATLAEAWMDGRRVLQSDNMFLAHRVEVEEAGERELALCFRALHPALARRRGRGRWRPRMIEPASLRWVRTTLLGHMPGWCPPVHAVGPWRPVERVRETGPLRVHAADLRAALDGTAGLLSLTLRADWLDGERPSARVEVAGQEAPLRWDDSGTLRGEVRLEGVAPWWPHTHGEPALHSVRATVGGVGVDLGRTGFRSLEVDRGADGAGWALRVNGERIFARGACWSSADVVSLPCSRAAYEPWLRRMRDAGMNMVRVGGTMAYEHDPFWETCDELGLLVWQDFMFANLDYPAQDEAWAAGVRAEAEQLLDRTQSHPSLAVLCGGSEVEQQAAMLGLPRDAWRSPLFDALLPEVAARVRPDVPYVPNSPTGGPLPFSPSAGVTHYYGVGAYLRPPEDARRAGVRFASECLAFANVPEAATVSRVLAPGEMPVHHPAWKRRVPRDAGASWDFEDVRDHYLERLYGVEPARLRREDPDRYLRMSRAVTGEVMEETVAEWRRAGSSCSGALVWLFQDLWDGAGWGVVDAGGAPKAAWHALRRAFRPVQAVITDEGLDGLSVHLVNETPRPVRGTLELAFLRHGEVPVARAERDVELAPRSATELRSAELLPAFFDAAYAYRFGPPAHDAAVATLRDQGGETLAEAFHFPLGRGSARPDPGMSAEVERDGDGWVLRLRAERLARSVHVEDDAFRAAEEWFHLPPGRERTVRLVPRGDSDAVPDGEVHALDAAAPVRFRGSR